MRSMVAIGGEMGGGDEGDWLTGKAKWVLVATSCVTVKVAEVASNGPVSARSEVRERREVSSDLTS